MVSDSEETYSWGYDITANGKRAKVEINSGKNLIYVTFKAVRVDGISREESVEMKKQRMSTKQMTFSTFRGQEEEQKTLGNDQTRRRKSQPQTTEAKEKSSSEGVL